MNRWDIVVNLCAIRRSKLQAGVASLASQFLCTPCVLSCLTRASVTINLIKRVFKKKKRYST